MAKAKKAPKGMMPMVDTENPLAQGKKKAAKGKGTFPAFLKKKKK